MSKMSNKQVMDLVDVQINSLLLGRVLTIIDASIQDERQTKAVKDLIKQCFRGQLNNIRDILDDRSLDVSENDEPPLDSENYDTIG